MRLNTFGVVSLIAIILVAFAGSAVFAQQAERQTPAAKPAKAQPLSLAQAEPRTAERTTTETRTEVKTEVGEDEVAERQSVDSWCTLEDGQPGTPGGFELEMFAGWTKFRHESEEISLEPEIEYTLDGSEFLRNTQLQLATPLELGEGDAPGTGDIVFGWQQRWVAENGSMPTLATLAQIRAPSGVDSSGVDGTLTGIIAKDFGPGTAIFNAWIKTANGHNIDELRHFQWGFRAGYKWRINDQWSVIGDYVHQTSEETGHSNTNALELSTEYKVNEHFSIGPGLIVGLDNHEETPEIGAGIKLLYSF
jgi:hypothetical protein